MGKTVKENTSIPWRQPADGPSLIGKQLSARLWIKSAYGLGRIVDNTMNSEIEREQNESNLA